LQHSNSSSPDFFPPLSIGALVFDGRPLFVCKYFRLGHWQIIKQESSASIEGVTPPSRSARFRARSSTQVKAATYRNGLYGSTQTSGDRCYVIEVNDNPNIDAKKEDAFSTKRFIENHGRLLRRIQERKA